MTETASPAPPLRGLALIREPSGTDDTAPDETQAAVASTTRTQAADAAHLARLLRGAPCAQAG